MQGEKKKNDTQRGKFSPVAGKSVFTLVLAIHRKGAVGGTKREKKKW